MTAAEHVEDAFLSSDDLQAFALQSRSRRLRASGSTNLLNQLHDDPAAAVTILHKFNGMDGAFPTAPPIQGLGRLGKRRAWTRRHVQDVRLRKYIHLLQL
jgi:hypothetical protein